MHIIFLTAKDSVGNIIEGLDARADDYLIKPFSKDELLARVRDLARRSDNIIYNNEIVVGNLSLNVEQCEITIFEDKQI